MADLVLHLKAEYSDAIRDGTKLLEYRLFTEFWKRRLCGRSYDRVILTTGYPKRGDESRRLVRRWRGCTIETITHPHFGADPVKVFAIDVSEAA